MLTLVALGLFLGMTLWFSATAAAPAIAAEFSITGAGLAWLTMAVQGGFVAGTLVSALLNLADVVNAARAVAARGIGVDPQPLREIGSWSSRQIR